MQRAKWTRIAALTISGALMVYVSSVLAQNAKSGVEIVNASQEGAPPSGPNKVVVEHDPGLATHTIYRPAELSASPYPLLVWGEGGCAKNGLTFPEYLSEIASHGYVIVADGPPVMRPPGAKGAPGKGKAGAPKAAAKGPGKGNAGPGAGKGKGPGPGALGNMTDGSALIAAVDWMERQTADRSSRFYNKVDTQHVAAMGMSCGGLMSYGASNDARVATVGIWNSGLIQPDEKIFAGLHSPVIIVTGGESDIAYANGKRDFETLPERIPVFYGVYPSVGHGGTYNQDNGGPFGATAVAWLNWQLKNDTSAKGKGYFLGPQCGLCGDSNWKIDSRSLR